MASALMWVRTSLATARAFASAAVGNHLVSVAPDVSRQKARTWDEGVSSKFSNTPSKTSSRGRRSSSLGCMELSLVFVQHNMFPATKTTLTKFKAKGINSVICVAVNDLYVMNGWAEKLQAKEAIEFYGDFDGKFHKSMELDLDLSDALLGSKMVSLCSGWKDPGS